MRFKHEQNYPFKKKKKLEDNHSYNERSSALETRRATFRRNTNNL